MDRATPTVFLVTAMNFLLLVPEHEPVESDANKVHHYGQGVEHVVPHGKRRGAESLVIGTRRVMERGRAHLQQDDISIEGDEHTEDIDPPDVPNSMHPPHVEADAGVVEHVEGDEAQPAGANWRHRVRREDRVGVLHPRESDHTG